jgi:Tfp pilus assembly protein PilO
MALSTKKKQISIDAAIEEGKKERQEKSTLHKVRRFLRVYLIPVTAIIIFFFVMIGLVIPKIFGIFGQIEMIDQMNDELRQRQGELASVRTMDNRSTFLEGDLATLDSLAPTGATEVVNFQSKIADLALARGLTVNNQVVSDSISTLSESFLDSNELLRLREVPNIFEISGNANNVFSFIQDLSSLGDFIVVDEMNLTAVENNQWNMRINIIKFQFAERGSEDERYQSYIQVPVTARIHSDIQEYLNSRSAF